MGNSIDRNSPTPSKLPFDSTNLAERATMTQSHHPSMAPDLDIKAVDEGYVVHQPDRDRVHHLNQTESQPGGCANRA
jgi:hypothetical protein